MLAADASHRRLDPVFFGIEPCRGHAHRDKLLVRFAHGMVIGGRHGRHHLALLRSRQRRGWLGMAS